MKKFEFSIESYSNWHRDAEWLFKMHYEELSLDKDRVKIGLNCQRYLDMEANDMLHVVTMRQSEGIIVGYYIAMVLPHMHYKDAGLMAYTDMYFIHPDYRVGGAGVKMLLFVEESLRRRGVVKTYITTKLKQDHTELLEGLGWKATDKVFTKFLR